ncbi:MAG TPA: hypothetical protein VNQ76_21040, partial [Planctomicrobium sp.]|nr:hypothetical protein [Planctomicrobium sp.]
NGSGISQCLRAAAENRIEAVPAEKQGELYHIALKAMATKQKDRYHTVQQFQDAIRNYRSHSESINLSERAAEDVVRAQESGDYADYARAVFGYEEALELWKHNASAREGVVQARLAYADAAYQKEDYDLGLSLLNDQQSDYLPMVARLRKGQRERNQRRSRLVAFRRVAAALLAVIFLGGSALSWQIYQEKQKVEVANRDLETAHGTINEVNDKIKVAQAEVTALGEEVVAKVKAAEEADQKAAQAKKDADEKIKIADASIKASADKVKLAEADVKKAEADIKTAELAKAKADQLAKLAQVEADKAQADANKALADAKQAQADADKAVAVAKDAQKAAAKAQAEEAYVSYTSSISQARNYIDQNQHSQAIQILKQIRESRPADQPLGWEWNRLWFEANRARVEPSSEGTPVDGRQVRFGTSGQRALVIYDNGGLELISVQPNGRNQHRAVTTGVPSVAAAFSPNESRVAVAGADGIIRLVDRESAQVVGQLQRLDLNGAKAPRVNAVQFLNDDLLVSASQDATIRLWNVAEQKELGVCWNLAPVLDLDVSPASTDGNWIIAAAVSDLRNGRVVVWRVTPNAEKEKFTRETDFLSHTAPVLTVAFDRTGQRVASGDQSGKILIWDWKQIGQLNYRDKISQAVSGLRNNSNAQPNSQPAQDDATVYSFSDPDLQGAVNSTRSTDNLRVAHRDAVQQVRFSPDGRHLVSASSDLTLKVWGLTNGRLVQTLRGQGGPVRSVDFSPIQPTSLMSAGSGGLVSWDLKRAGEVAVYREEAGTSESQITAHRDEILSAAFDRSGTRIVTSSRDHTARVLEIDPKTLEFKLIAKLQDEAPEGSSAGVLREGGEFVSLSMQVTADNSRLFVGGADGVIRIWNVTQGAEIGAISGTGLNSSFAISKDGRLVVTGSADPEAKALVWSVNEEGRAEKTPRWKLNGHKDTVTAFAISPDGRTLFTGDRRGTGLLWNVETGEPIGEPLLQHIGSRLNAAVFSPNGQELIVASDDRTASRVNTSNGELIEKLQHDGFVTDLSLSPNGQQLFTISEIPENNDTRTRLQLWNLGSGVASTSVTVDQGVVRRRQSGDQLEQQRQIRSIRFGENSSTALSVQFDPQTRKSELKIWELNPNEAPQLVRGLAFPGKVADTELVVAGPAGQIFTLNGDAVFLWDLKQLGHMRSYRPHAAVTQASFSADGKFVATSSKTVKIWSVESEKSLFQLEYPHNGAVRSVAFSPIAGSYDLLTGGDDGNVKLWNWDPQTTTVKEVRTFTGQGTPVRRVSFSADGELVLGVGDDGFSKIWKTADPAIGISLSRPEQPAGTLATNYLGGAISPDKKWVVAGGQDRTTRLWRIADDLKSATLVREFSGHADEVTDVKFLAAENEAQFRIVTASRDSSVRVWDPRIDNLDDNVTPRELLALRRHSLGVTAVDATSNNDLLLSAGLDGEVILWPTRVQP